MGVLLGSGDLTCRSDTISILNRIGGNSYSEILYLFVWEESLLMKDFTQDRTL